MTKPHRQPSKGQKAAFIAAAEAAEADTDESRWEARLKAVAKPPVKADHKGKDTVRTTSIERNGQSQRESRATPIRRR